MGNPLAGPTNLVGNSLAGFSNLIGNPLPMANLSRSFATEHRIRFLLLPEDIG